MSTPPTRRKHGRLGRVPSPAARGSELSVPGLAAYLGVSVPRLHRALDAEGVPLAGGRGHRRLVPGAVARRLARRLGAVPQMLPGFDRTEMLVLGAVARAPLGLSSARAVARAAGVSPTAAGAALTRFQTEGLVVRRERRVVHGRVRRVCYWVADLLHPAWTAEVLRAANNVVLPIRVEPEVPPRRVPSTYGHAFWNVDPRSVDPRRHPDFVAARLLQLDDAGAWAWAARNLPARSLRRAARSRGVDAGRRALVENLLAARRAG